MIRLRVLGGAVVERDGVLMKGRAAQSHHLALLAFLSVAPGRTATRERLIGLLWPDSETARARHRLSVALHVLRRTLGGDVVITVGDAVTLNRAAIQTDVGAFIEAISNGRSEEAVALYDGPFLDGFYLNGARDFERWMDGERSRLGGLCRSALERLASQGEDAGDLRTAIEWRRSLAQLAPYEASAALALVRSLAASGDVAAALAHARVHVARVEGELGIPANPKVLALADELAQAARARRNEGEGDLLAATTPSSEGPQELEDGAPSLSSVSAVNHPRGRLALWMAAVPVVAAAMLWSFARGSDVERLGAESSMAVLAFEAPSAERSAALAEDLASAIRTTLEIVPNLRMSGPLPGGTEARDAVRAGRELGVARVVTGTMEGEGGEGSPVQVVVRLTDVRSGEVEWEGTYNRQGVPPNVLIELLSLSIADDLRLRVAPYIPHHYTSDEVANDEFLAGVFEHRKLTEQRIWVAIQHYRRATERDPTFALAWAIQGTAYMSLAGQGLTPAIAYEEGRWRVSRALELDPQLAEGYATLARLQLYWDRNFAGAERSLRRAFMLYPTHPDGREWYGWYLLFYRGDTDAAISSVRRALELDPLNTARSRAVERILFMARRFEEIPAQSRHTWSLGPDVAATIDGPFLADAYREMGRYDEAIREYSLYHERRGGRTPFGLAITYARIGREEEARSILREWEADLNPRYRRIAQIHAALGNVDEGLDWLERAFEATPTAVLDLKVNVDYDPLRSHPRFDDLVRRVGLEAPR